MPTDSRKPPHVSFRTVIRSIRESHELFTNTMRIPLKTEELRALRELSRGSVRNRVEPTHAQKLVELGFARRTADGVAITRVGREFAAVTARAPPPV